MMEWCRGKGWLLALLLAGCGGDSSPRLDALTQQMAQQQQVQEALEARLQSMEQVPQLEFVISRHKLTIEEQMFQPLLKSSAQLQAKGDDVPYTFYVDMLLQVEVPEEDFVAMSRQVFPVFEGKSQIELMQPLPVHGLQKKDIKITLRPMNWYGSQRIEPARVTYR